jgi:cell division protein FtsB
VRWDRAGRVGLLVVLVVVLGLYVEHALSYLSTRAQADQALATVHQLVRENHALEREQQALQQPGTIIGDARALGMVRPGERSYVIMGRPGR